MNQEFVAAHPPVTPPKPQYDRIFTRDQMKSLSKDELHNFAEWLAKEIATDIVMSIQAGNIECGQTLTYGMVPAYRDLDTRVDDLYHADEEGWSFNETFANTFEATIYDETMWLVTGDEGDGTVTHLVCPGDTKQSCVNPENGWFKIFETEPVFRDNWNKLADCHICGLADPQPNTNILAKGWTKEPIDPAWPHKGYYYYCPEHGTKE